MKGLQHGKIPKVQGDGASVFHADCERARWIHHRLRHQVYCLDKGFEDPERFSEKLEYDQFDSRATHFIAQDISTGNWNGAARAIIDPWTALPMFEHVVLPDAATRKAIPRPVEMSRLLVSRRPMDDEGTMLSESVAAGYSSMLSLIAAVRAYALDRDASHLVFLTTPALARILRRMRLDLQPLGEAVRHRGLRIPFSLELEDGFSMALKRGSALASIGRGFGPYHSFSETLCVSAGQSSRMSA